MAFWRRIWQRDSEELLASCTALDVGTEFAKALVFDIDEGGHGTVRGVGRKRQGLSHMQSGTVADIAAVVDNCAVALQEAGDVVIGIGSNQLVDAHQPQHACALPAPHEAPGQRHDRQSAGERVEARIAAGPMQRIQH